MLRYGNAVNFAGKPSLEKQPEYIPPKKPKNENREPTIRESIETAEKIEEMKTLPLGERIQLEEPKKYCKYCGRMLPVSQFRKYSLSVDGLAARCKECGIKMQKQKYGKRYYDKDRDLPKEIRERNKRERERLEDEQRAAETDEKKEEK